MSTPLDLQPAPESTDAPQAAEASPTAAIEQAIQASAAGAIHDLRVLVDGRNVTLMGGCNSHGINQQAKKAAEAVSGGRIITNHINVFEVG